MEDDFLLHRLARLISVPSRAAMLLALADGRALPAGELAFLARVSNQTASAGKRLNFRLPHRDFLNL